MTKFYGIFGKKYYSDEGFVVLLVNVKDFLKYIDELVIRIPDFQRELDQCKIDKIVKYYLKEIKKNENIFNHSEFKLACHIIEGTTYVRWLVDGQHRVEAIKILIKKGYMKDSDLLRLTIKRCNDYKGCHKYFKTININSNMEPIYKELSSSFNDKLIFDLKKDLKIHYCLGFHKQKNHKKYYHLDEFLELFQYENLKDTYYVDKHKQLIVKKILTKLLQINNSIKEDINFEYYSLPTISKLQTTNIYFTLKYVNILELFQDDGAELVIKQELKLKQLKKKKICKALRLKVWNKYIGEEKRKGKCDVCKSLMKIENFQCGHIIAESQGGKTNINNLKPICPICNQSMGTQNMDEFQKKNFSNDLTL